MDSTNVCHPAVSVITSISYDHTRQLGNTLSSIAREKAGIVKPGVPLISGVEQAEPLQMIIEAAAKHDSRLLTLGQDFHFQTPAAIESRADLLTSADSVVPGNCFDYQELVDGDSVQLPHVTIPMFGRHQAANASVAIATLIQLRRDGWQLDEQQIRHGLAQARCPARIEVVRHHPTVVLDAAHNRASVTALLEVLRQQTVTGCRILVFSTSVDKDVDGMLAELMGEFDQVILTRYLNNPRAIQPARLAQLYTDIASQNGTAVPPLKMCPDPDSAWQLAQSLASPDDLICVTGSFFLGRRDPSSPERPRLTPRNTVVNHALP